MASKFYQKMVSKIPEEMSAFTGKSMDISLRINALMEARGLSQKDLASALEKSPSQISNWLAGNHNFTLKQLLN